MSSPTWSHHRIVDTQTHHYSFIDMPGTVKNILNDVNKEIGRCMKARKTSHSCIWITWDRYVGGILDTRFKVTGIKLNLELFDIGT